MQSPFGLLSWLCIMNCPGFVRGLFLQNSGGFFKGVQLCIEFILHFLRRPMANGAM